MTLFVATVAGKAAYLTQDTFGSPLKASAATAALTHDPAVAIASAYGGNGVAPPQAPICFVPKIQTLPHLNTVVGGAGDWLLIFSCAAALTDNQRIGDIADFGQYAQSIFQARLAFVGRRRASIVLALGFSHAEQRAVGWVFSSDDDFKPVRLSEGHSMMPAPDVTAPDYGPLADSWEPAAYGVGTEAFHQAVAWNQYHASAAGKFPEGSGIGGQLMTAKVTPGEVTIRVVDQFPGFQEQRARLAASHGSGQ